MAHDLTMVLRDIDKANGLPSAFYTSDELFETEKQNVFFKNWFAVGVGADVPEPGDARPVDIFGQPLLVVRGQDGALNVYENVCRHRGMKLIESPQNLKGVIRCPYHYWCYGLDGQLRSTPHVGGPGRNDHEAIDKDDLGLTRVNSHVWLDIIFVNISGDAPDFEDHAHDLIERWSEFNQPLFHGGPESSFSIDLKCNWKLAVENYCESYHLPFVHPDLAKYSRLEDHYTISGDSKFSGQGTTVYNPQLGHDGRKFPSFKNLDAKWEKAAEYVALYPNVLIGVHKDHTFVIIIEPVGPSEITERVEIYYTEEIVRGADWAGLREANARLWQQVFKEDIFVCEGMQKGRAAAHFDGGRFSPAMDTAVHEFNVWVANQIQPDAST